MARGVGHGKSGPFAAAVPLMAAMLTMGAGISVAQEKAPPSSVPEATEPAPPATSRRGTSPSERGQPAPGCPFKERKLELIV